MADKEVPVHLDGVEVLKEMWLFCLLPIAMALLSLVYVAWLARIPTLAARNKVESLDLLLRIADTHADDPTYLLEKEDDLERVRIRFPADHKYGRRDYVKSVEGVRIGNYEYQLNIKFDRGSPLTLVTTTPTTQIPVEELNSAREMLGLLYPRREDQEALRNWGQSLKERWWYKHKKEEETGFIPIRLIWVSSGEDKTGQKEQRHPEQDEESLWFAWKRLEGGSEQAAKDLPRLGSLVRNAYPQGSDYRSAMAWARTIYDRHQSYHSWIDTIRSEKLATLAGTTSKIRFQSRKMVPLPPRSEFAYWWLLYHYVGVTDGSREAVRDRWLKFFPPGKVDAVLSWGRKLEAQRRADGEALPPSSVEVVLLCVIERLTGTDFYGERCRTIIQNEISNVSIPLPKQTAWDALSNAQGMIEVCYPTDDFIYLWASEDRLRLHPGRIASISAGGRLGIIVLAVIVFGATFWGFRLLIYGILAECLLLLRNNPRYRKYRDRHHPWRWDACVISYLVIPLINWQVAWMTLPQHLSVTVTYWSLLLGVYLSLLIGGAIVLVVTRVTTILLIRLGVDVAEHSWVMVIGLTLGALVLYHFDNDPLGILASTCFALVPELYALWGKKSQVPSPHTQAR